MKHYNPVLHMTCICVCMCTHLYASMCMRKIKVLSNISPVSFTYNPFLTTYHMLLLTLLILYSVHMAFKILAWSSPKKPAGSEPQGLSHLYFPVLRVEAYSTSIFFIIFYLN